MSASDATSVEHLDLLFAEGRITDEDYRTLRSALETEEANQASKGAREVDRLRKSWANRQLGGVCAGIAAKLGMETSTVRLLFLLAFLFTGGTAILVYLVLFIVLPWDQDVSVLKDRKGRFPWLFLSVLGVEAAVLWLFMVFMSPRVVEVFSNLGAELPVPARIAVSVCHVFSNVAMGFVAYPIGVVLMVGVYLWLPAESKARRAFGAVSVFGLLFCIVALLLALYLPVAALGQGL
ncbi:MAG: PspC domain-containing protein [bacterium]|nr:PspC domain-containing protein [bacterium]